jgi:hypothetical protein
MRDRGKRVLMNIPQLIFWICFSLFVSAPIPSLSASGESKANGSVFLVRVKDNLLTVKLKHVLLEKVLTEIANQTGIQISIDGPMEELVSADFSDLPLDKGMKRLLRDVDHIFIYRGAKARAPEPEIRKVIIYSKRGEISDKRSEPRVIGPENRPPRNLKQTPQESLVRGPESKNEGVQEKTVDFTPALKDEKSIVELTAVLLNDKDEEARGKAAQALGDLRDKRAISALIQALKDKDAGVRESAVDALGTIGGEEVIRPLMDALKDEDEDVREAAAEALKNLTGKDFSH